MLRYLFKKLNGHYLKYFLILFISSVLAILGAIIPKLSGYFIDSLIEYRSISGIYQFLILLTGITIFQLFLLFILTIVKTLTMAELSFSIRSEKITKFSKKSIEHIESVDIPELSQMLFADSEVLSSFFPNFYSFILTSSLTTVVIIGIMFSMNKVITIYVMGATVVYFIYLFIIRKKLYKKELALKYASTSYFGKITNSLLSMKLIKLFVLLEDSMSTLKKNFLNFKKILISYQLTAFFFTSGDIILTTFALLAIFLIGGRLYIENKITIGDITIFMSYSNILFSELKKFSDYYSQYVSAKVSYERIEKNFVDNNIEYKNQKPLLPIKKLSIVSVNFEHIKDNNKRKIRYDDIIFKQGFLYVLTGGNGSGKSTLLNLISGLYSDRYEGKISINGTNLKYINEHFFSSNVISYLTQEPLYYWGESLEKNLNLKNNKSTRIDELMMKLNISYSVLSNNQSSNSNLSGGEYQKLNIMRALTKKFEILLLDEPTNQLDENSINQLIEEILYIKKNKIVIISTHDEKIISHADIIIKM